MDRITLRRPDDWHLHLRDGAAMAAVLADSARRFARAIVMPNLKPPLRTTQEALAYRSRILAALPAGAGELSAPTIGEGSGFCGSPDSPVRFAFSNAAC